MKKKNLLWLGMAFLLLLPLFQGCGKSKLVTSWMDVARPQYKLEKVLVVAVFKDPVTQKIFERSFVQLFEKNGVRAVAGNSYGLTGQDEPHKQAIDTAVQKSGATSVLITHILSVTTNTYHDPGMDDYVVYGGYWDSVSGYHSYVYHQVWAAESTIEKRLERMEVTIYDTGDGKPVWSARSESVNLEERLKKDDEQLEALFIADLRKKDIL